jgi:hypothetical protein
MLFRFYEVVPLKKRVGAVLATWCWSRRFLKGICETVSRTVNEVLYGDEFEQKRTEPAAAR